MGNYFVQIFFMLKAKSSSLVLWFGHGKTFFISLFLFIICFILAVWMYEIPTYSMEVEVDDIFKPDSVHIRNAIIYELDYGRNKVKSYWDKDDYGITLWSYIPYERKPGQKRFLSPLFSSEESYSIVNSTFNKYKAKYDKDLRVDDFCYFFRMKVKENYPPHILHVNYEKSRISDNQTIFMGDKDTTIARYVYNREEVIFGYDSISNSKSTKEISYVGIYNSNVNTPIRIPHLSTWERPNVFCLYDISQCYFHIRHKIDNMSSFELNLCGAVDFYDISPEPDEKTMSSIKYTSPYKLHIIREKGLWLFAKFAQLENIQLFRMFVITTLWGFFTSLTFSSLVRILRTWSRRFKMKNNKEILHK